jgi:glycine betaine/choline ABC-type transport system substrate-binding protein/ABC-type proline/glycine betaine transport system permease subunit
MNEAARQLPGLLTAHLQLTLAALAAGALSSIPAGVLVSRVPRLERPVLGLAGVIQTIPALAFLAVMVPLLSGLGLPGIGPLPAFIGLTLYSVLPMLRNTVTGLAGIEPAVIEAARGIGMTDAQRLRRVELPLALPVIVAGVRTAAVWTVGMATLSTPVGAPSLGNLIFGGLQTRNLTSVLLGCAASAALALVLDGVIQMLARGLAERRRALQMAGGLGLGALVVWAVAATLADGRAVAERPVRIGAKTFTEQYVLSEILAGQIHRFAGAPAEVTASLGSTVAFDALVRGEIDAYVDYTGTIWATLMGRSGGGPGRAAVLAEVKSWLATTHGVGVAAALGFENSYAFAVSRATADRLRLASLTDLARRRPLLRAAADYEFWQRSEWVSVERVYDLGFAERRTMDPSLLYAAVAQGQVDVVTAYSSDGRIAAYDLVVLDDDRRAIPPYDAVVLVAPRLAAERPEVMAALAALEGRIPVERMRALNRQVDEDGLGPAAVAKGFLSAEGARPTGAPPESPGPRPGGS